jgi:hypothetical protein
MRKFWSVHKLPLRLSRDRKSWRETHQTLLKDLNNSSSIATINDRGVALIGCFG